MKETINSNAAIIGSLPSFEVIYKIIKFVSEGNSRDEIIKNFSDTNLFNKRTEESRLRILRAVDDSVLQFKNQKHAKLIYRVYNEVRMKQHYDFVFFLHLLVSNRLFYLIGKNVYLDIYFSGRMYIKNEDVVAFLYHLRETELDLQKWTDSTIKTTASKTLTLLKKLHFLEGKQKKEINHITINHQQKVLLICMILSVEPEINNLLESKYIGFFFTEKVNLISVLKDLKLTEYFDIYSTGNSINIKVKKDIKEIINAISNRA